MTAETQQNQYSILVIDDDSGTARLARSWFNSEQYEVLSAPDGEAGLAMIDAKLPDLILLDLSMPKVDGIEVAKRLKQNMRTRSIPIVVLTASRNLNTKVITFDIGAEDFVTKPFEMEEVAARIKRLLNKQTQLNKLEVEVQDLTDQKDQLEDLLMLDEKTGLYNFREFQKRLRQEWSRASRYNVPLSLVFFDLDHFKQVNDRLGHQAGDEALREFATLVTGGARENDLAARYGGEEFAVILPHTEAPMAMRVADRIRRAVAEFAFLSETTHLQLTVSAGVATYPSTPELDTVDMLIRAADEALYSAKDRGRNRVVEAAGVSTSGDAAGAKLTDRRARATDPQP
jgi:two-component system cell cycle response regulator